MTPRWAQDGLKTGPRRVQERSKSDAFFVLIFDSFGGRLGVVWGAVLDSKIDPKGRHRFAIFAVHATCVCVSVWIELWGRLGAVLGGSWATLGGSWAPFGGSWGAFGSS